MCRLKPSKMKKTLTLFLFLFSASLFSQNYYAGSPVYDTLITNHDFVGDNPTPCPRLYINFDPSLTQSPAGTQVYFKIVSVSMPPNTLYESNIGVLNLNDSFPVTPADCAFQFYALNTIADFNFAFLRCGTPLFAGDTFTCSSDIELSIAVLVDGCSTIMQKYFYSSGVDTCYVNGPLTLNENGAETNKLIVFPNPATEMVTVLLPRSGDDCVIEIFDIGGKIVKTVYADAKMSKRNASVDLSGMINGMYNIRVTDNQEIYTARIIKQ